MLERRNSPHSVNVDNGVGGFVGVSKIFATQDTFSFGKGPSDRVYANFNFGFWANIRSCAIRF